MLNDVEYQGLIRMIGHKVENSVIHKADKLKIDVREYIKHSDERYCLVLLNQCLLGVNKSDADYSNYFTEEDPNKFKVERDGEVVMRECDALLNLTAFEKRDSEPFYKWGYLFETDTQGNLIIRSCNGRIQIKPEVANKITISMEN
jgi:hypothetical protein